MAHQPFQTPYCVCRMSCGRSSYRRKNPMDPMAMPQRPACNVWAVRGERWGTHMCERMGPHAGGGAHRCSHSLGVAEGLGEGDVVAHHDR